MAACCSAAQAFDAMAIGVAAVALPWLVLKAGGSHGQAGLVYVLTVVPYVVFGLVAGRRERSPLAARSVMLSAHAFQALCALVIPLWTIAGTPPLGVMLPAGVRDRRRSRVRGRRAASGPSARSSGVRGSARGRPRCRPPGELGLFAGPALGGRAGGSGGAGLRAVRPRPAPVPSPRCRDRDAHAAPGPAGESRAELAGSRSWRAFATWPAARASRSTRPSSSPRTWRARARTP